MTSLYAHNFTLLPRPPRSACFSLGSEETRARLPDFANVAQLSAFMHRLFVYRVDSSMYIQIKVGASFIALLVVIIGLTLARRMYDRSFWIIRWQKRPSGYVLVPNAMLAFCIMEGAYGAVFIAFVWEVVAMYETQSRSPVTFPLWICMPWCPLITGAIWAAWGTHFATPARLTPSLADRPGLLRRLAGHAWTINAMGLLIPIVICASVTAPAVLATHQHGVLYRRQLQWQATYARQRDFTEPMVQQAQQIWFDEVAAARYVGVFFAVWTVWAVVLLVVYSWVVVRLIASIARELRKCKVVDESRRSGVQERPTATQLEAQRKVDEMLQRLSDARKEGGSEGGIKASAGSGVANESSSYDECRDAEKEAAGAVAAPNDNDDDDDDDEDTDAPLPEPQRRRWLTMPNILLQPRTTTRVHRLPAHMRELRKAMVHISVQGLSVAPAALMFAVIAAILSATVRGGMEQPTNGDGDEVSGNQLEFWFKFSTLWINYVTCVFGASTMLAIAFRTYSSWILATPTSADAGQFDDDTVTPPQGETQAERRSRRSTAGHRLNARSTTTTSTAPAPPALARASRPFSSIGVDSMQQQESGINWALPDAGEYVFGSGRGRGGAGQPGSYMMRQQTVISSAAAAGVHKEVRVAANDDADAATSMAMQSSDYHQQRLESRDEEREYYRSGGAHGHRRRQVEAPAT